jgi:aldehyde:ferredoxin oxidoreductase
MALARKYIGGIGLGTRILFDEVPPGAAPLGPDNKLLFMTGPLVGTAFPASAGIAVVTRSPLTGLLTHDSLAGHWGASLKQSGYDGIILEGTSPRPVWLDVSDSGAEIKDAAGLWGTDAIAAEEKIRGQFAGPDAQVVGIGPAGEGKVPLACLVGDGGRAFGRGGIGAVMGSKNLKAITVQGAKAVPVAEEASFNQVASRIAGIIGGNRRMAMLFKWGTAYHMDSGWQKGAVPTQNWRVGLWKEGCINLGGKKMADTILQPHGSCLNCPVRCTRWVKIAGGKHRMEGAGPEYETLAALGSLCLNDNLEAVCKADDLCKRYGLDTVSVGAVIAFAMEAHERGLLNGEATDGLDLGWGNSDTIIELVERIAARKGLGELLSQGVKAASEKLGAGSEAFAMHVKGMEMAMYDPRAYFSLGAAYATGPNPACDLTGAPSIFELHSSMPEAGVLYRQDRFDRFGKGLAAKVGQDVTSVLSSMVICIYPGLTLAPLHLAEALSSATGFDYTSAEVLRAGERIVNLQRMYNLRCGMDGAGDRLPSRLLEPLGAGGSAERAPNTEDQLREYRKLRGWSEDGRPTKEKLEELDLAFAAP